VEIIRSSTSLIKVNASTPFSVHGPAAASAGRLLDLNQHLDPWQVRRR
jgi:hypothetical protein